MDILLKSTGSQYAKI